LALGSSVAGLGFEQQAGLRKSGWTTDSSVRLLWRTGLAVTTVDVSNLAVADVHPSAYAMIVRVESMDVVYGVLDGVRVVRA
jgi:hypothetical protein